MARRRTCPILLVLAGLAVTMLATGILWGAGWIQRPGLRRGELFDFGSGPAPRWDGEVPLVVMTWNMAYARGPNPDNEVNEVPAKSVAEERLRQMGALIRDAGADIVLLQEIDFDSKRSRRIDQLARLASSSGLRYGARAVSWQANYIPFPYWPPSQHYGRVLSGGAVLSRYPLGENRVLLHPKPKANPWWYNLFYLFRYTQAVRVDLGGRQVWVLNNHLEAWDKVNRQAQARALTGQVEALGKDAVRVVVFGGDLNTTPPEATRKHGFADSPEDDYRDDNTIDLLRRVPGMREVVPVERYVADEASHFTFPTLEPTRRLDYLFVDTRASVEGYRMLRTGGFSDHLPVVATLRLPPS